MASGTKTTTLFYDGTLGRIRMGIIGKRTFYRRVFSPYKNPHHTAYTLGTP